MNARQLNFAYKIRHALNENAENLPAATLEKLAGSRKLALARKKKDSALRMFASETMLAGRAGAFFGERFGWLARMGIAIPLLAVVLGVIGIHEIEEQQRINEIAQIDADVLSDDLPLSAYVDHGFNAFLADPGAQGGR